LLCRPNLGGSAAGRWQSGRFIRDPDFKPLEVVLRLASKRALMLKSAWI
jgi:hypothetical protein